MYSLFRKYSAPLLIYVEYVLVICSIKDVDGAIDTVEAMGECICDAKPTNNVSFDSALLNKANHCLTRKVLYTTL